MVFVSLPLALAGGVLAIAITGADMTLGSISGLVAIVAIAARGTVLLIRNYEKREARGDAFGVDLVVDGTAELIVPTVGPILALAAVFMPLAAASGLAGLEVVGPMAVVVLGGLITTALLVLMVLPALYLRWGHIEDPDTTTHGLFEADPRAAVMGGD